MRNHQGLRPALLQASDETTGGIRLRDVVQRRITAKLVGHAATSELAILNARRRVAAARSLTEEIEGELQLRRTLRGMPAEQSRRVLAPEVEIERLLLQREQLRQQRLVGSSESSAASLPALPGAVEWDLNEKQLEALAVKAVTCFSHLGPAEAERAWTVWRRELGLRLPPYAAEEVERRARQLRELAGE